LDLIDDTIVVVKDSLITFYIADFIAFFQANY